jgi:adenosylcobinamide kinase/adenosylcobinamide-phosphate guanylyltransferase
MREGVVLVLGGARSGKSAYAERLVRESGLAPVYVATAEPGDAEMQARGLEEALLAEAHSDRALLVDCLTLWVSNLLHLRGVDLPARIEGLLHALRELPGLIVLVSNEVGQGIVPANALARRFRDVQGQLNQAVARTAGRVVYLVAGLPLVLKG